MGCDKLYHFQVLLGCGWWAHDIIKERGTGIERRTTIMEMQEFYTERLKIAKSICDKIVALDKRHPQKYEEEDAIKQAETIAKIYNKLPNG